MKAVFADTSYFVALCGPNDAFPARVAELSAWTNTRPDRMDRREKNPQLISSHFRSPPTLSQL
jgi:hypothetical protein